MLINIPNTTTQERLVSLINYHQLQDVHMCHVQSSPDYTLYVAQGMGHMPQHSEAAIYSPRLGIIHGTVISAQNYGTKYKADWYVELSTTTHGYIYFKQQQDEPEAKVVWHPLG